HSNQGIARFDLLQCTCDRDGWKINAEGGEILHNGAPHLARAIAAWLYAGDGPAVMCRAAKLRLAIAGQSNELSDVVVRCDSPAGGPARLLARGSFSDPQAPEASQQVTLQMDRAVDGAIHA